MKLLIAAAGAVILASALAGCSPTPATTATDTNAATESTATPTPALDPGPVELTIEEAADRYLDLVCQNNFAGAELTAAFDAGEQEFLDGGAPDPSAVKAVAAKLVDLNRKSVALLDDDYYLWPEKVAIQLPNIRDIYMAELATLNTMANATSFENAYYTTWPAATPEQAAAGQEIRYQLGLDSNTTTSCTGHEIGLDALTVELTEREAALSE